MQEARVSFPICAYNIVSSNDVQIIAIIRKVNHPDVTCMSVYKFLRRLQVANLRCGSQIVGGSNLG